MRSGGFHICFSQFRVFLGLPIELRCFLRIVVRQTPMIRSRLGFRDQLLHLPVAQPRRLHPSLGLRGPQNEQASMAATGTNRLRTVFSSIIESPLISLRYFLRTSIESAFRILVLS